MSTRLAFVTGLALGVLTMILLAAVYVVAAVSAAPRQCPEGRAPATNPRVTSACFVVGDPLPKGYSWDPGGNKRH